MSRYVILSKEDSKKLCDRLSYLCNLYNEANDSYKKNVGMYVKKIRDELNGFDIRVEYQQLCICLDNNSSRENKENIVLPVGCDYEDFISDDVYDYLKAKHNKNIKIITEDIKSWSR